MEPLVIVNTKCYERGTALGALDVALACEKFGAVIAAQPTDIFRIATNTKASVFAQHIDPVSFGAHTGSVTAHAVRLSGATGTLINHSEKKLSFKEVKFCVGICKKAGLVSVVCADSLDQAISFDSLKPDFIALELPELIGGDVSITSSDPDLIRTATKSLSSKVLVGAGINSGNDVKLALELGSYGVLVASFVVTKSSSPLNALKELYSGISM